MADNLKGEVSFEAQGRTWTLVYSINALAALETKLDLDAPEIARRMGRRARLGFKRAVLAGGLRTHHPEITDDAAGDLMQALGVAATDLLTLDALLAAFPRREVADDGEADPPLPPAGTGATSSTSGTS